MSTSTQVRDNLLLKGLSRPVALNAIDRKVKQRNPSASNAEVQDETLEAIRSLVDDGLFRLGALEKRRFVPSKRPLDRSIHKISRRYVNHYDNPKRWMYSAWMMLTAKGEELALSLEKRGIDLYRHDLIIPESCQNEVTQELSPQHMCELKQLRAQIVNWQTTGDLINRAVA
jgi:hypothetical protein